METELSQFKAHLSVFSGTFDAEAVVVVVRFGDLDATLRALELLAEAGVLEVIPGDHGNLYCLKRPGRVPPGKSWRRLCERHLYHYSQKSESATIDGRKGGWLQTNACNVSVALARAHRFVLEHAALPAGTGNRDAEAKVLRAALSIVRVGLWSQSSKDTATAAKLLLDIRRSQLWETLDARSKQETSVYLRYVHDVRSHSSSPHGSVDSSVEEQAPTERSPA